MEKRQIKRNGISGFCLAITVLFLNSCSMLHGIKKSKRLSDADIVSLARKNKIMENLHSIDFGYKQFILSIKITDHHVAKNHLQPIQALYFDENHKLISFIINCYAEPSLLNLNWNKGKNFDQFPPVTLAPLDSLLSEEDIKKSMTVLKGRGQGNDKKSKYTVYVFWNRKFLKYSKSLIKFVRQNAKLSNDALDIVYINNDNYLYDLLVERK